MTYAFGPFELDELQCKLRKDGVDLPGGRKVFDLLLFLIEHRDRVVMREELQKRLWPDVIVDASALGRIVKEARRLLDDDSDSPRIIETRRGFGYRFVAPVCNATACPALMPADALEPRAAPQLHDDDKTVSHDSRRTAHTSPWPGVQWLFPEHRFVSFVPGGVVRLGRMTDCEFPLPGSECSRRHACLEMDGSSLTIRDLDSHNGTFVNGERVTDAQLRFGDVVRMGDWIGVVEQAARQAPGPLPGFYGRVVGGETLAEALEPVRRACHNDTPIHVIGAVGTGRKAVAQAIHVASGRTGACLTYKCAGAFDSTAAEAIFGTSGGTPGLFVQAFRGTLILEGLSELEGRLQSRLARALAQGALLAPGLVPIESFGVTTNVRLVTIETDPLADLERRGRLRSDLAAAIAGLEVRVPPLSERRSDVPALFMHFLQRHSGGRSPQLTSSFLERLLLHDWRQHVRELEVLARTMLVLEGGTSTWYARHLRPPIGRSA